MDRRSWLWRRRSSEKNSSEIESSGSPPPERLSDDQQALSKQNTVNTHPSEVTSNCVKQDEDVDDAVKILTEKLSVALANVNAKEESVKQHAKVVEEVVAGWEKAEKEVITLKQQLDLATKKNSSLEDRIAHLDEALKECLRQLRQVREDQDKKVQEAIAKKSQQPEFNKSDLEDQLANLHSQLEMMNAKAEAAASLESDLQLKLGIFEKENASLQMELHSRSQDLEVMTLERDLSTKTAETASKQNLDSIKRVAKLEAECRRLKNVLRKATLFNDHKSFSASPSHVDSFTDSLSDYGERLTDCGQSHSDTWTSILTVELDPFKHEKISSKLATTPSLEINLMDDFLEMERLASLPARETRSCSLGSMASTDKQTGDYEASLKAQLETMINRTTELEEKIEMLEAEKVEFSLTLSLSQDRLKLSENSLKQVQTQFHECQNQLKISQAQSRDMNRKMGMLQAELDLANELRQAIELELEDANVRKEEAESQLRDVDSESKLLLSRVAYLEGEAEKERSLYSKISSKCQALEDKLSKMTYEADTRQSELTSMKDSEQAAYEQELLSTNAKKEAVESQLKSVQAELESLLAKVSFMEGDTENERQMSADFANRCRKLEDELSRMKNEAETWKYRLASENYSKEVAEKELQTTYARREEVESQLKGVRSEVKSLLAKIEMLEMEVEKERMISAEFANKCLYLEDKLSKMKCEADFQIVPPAKEELNIQKEKELAVAANNLAECQKTIASLSNQLKSLVMLEDLFTESDKQLMVVGKDSNLHDGIELLDG